MKLIAFRPPYAISSVVSQTLVCPLEPHCTCLRLSSPGNKHQTKGIMVGLVGWYMPIILATQEAGRSVTSRPAWTDHQASFGCDPL